MSNYCTSYYYYFMLVNCLNYSLLVINYLYLCVCLITYLSVYLHVCASIYLRFCLLCSCLPAFFCHPSVAPLLISHTFFPANGETNSTLSSLAMSYSISKINPKLLRRICMSLYWHRNDIMKYDSG